MELSWCQDAVCRRAGVNRRRRLTPCECCVRLCFSGLNQKTGEVTIGAEDDPNRRTNSSEKSCICCHPEEGQILVLIHSLLPSPCDGTLRNGITHHGQGARETALTPQSARDLAKLSHTALICDLQCVVSRTRLRAARTLSHAGFLGAKRARVYAARSSSWPS